MRFLPLFSRRIQALTARLFRFQKAFLNSSRMRRTKKPFPLLLQARAILLLRSHLSPFSALPFALSMYCSASMIDFFVLREEKARRERKAEIIRSMQIDEIKALKSISNHSQDVMSASLPSPPSFPSAPNERIAYGSPSFPGTVYS